MEPGFFGAAGGSLNSSCGGINDGRIQGAGSQFGQHQSRHALAQAQALGAGAVKEASPIERELQQLEQNVKRLFGDIDDLARQLAPVIVPQLEEKNTVQGEQTGLATSPLHRSIYASNVHLTKLAAQIAHLRASLSI